MTLKSTFCSLLAVLVCTATSPMLFAQKQLTFTATETSLTLTSATPALNQGDTFEVVITDITTPKDTWSFSLGTEPMEFIGASPLTYRLVIPNTLSGLTTLSFTDSDGQMSLPPGPPIRLNIGTGPSGATSATAPPTLANVRNTYNRSTNRIRLYFDESGLPYRGNIPTDIDDNDVIEIFMVAPRSTADALSVAVEGTFASDDFSIEGASALSDLKSNLGVIQGTGEDEDDIVVVPMGTFGPYQAGSITIKINKTEDGTTTTLRSYVSKINKTYLASLRVGVGQSTVRFNQYEVATFMGDPPNMRILNTSDEDGEPRLYLTVVFYGAQLGSLNFWNGRDLNEPPTLINRITPYAGIGLKSFGEEFLVGLSFEVMRGLNVMWGLHIAESKQLAGGFSEGDLFTGMASALPTTDRWHYDPRFFGVSVDIRVATQIIGLFN